MSIAVVGNHFDIKVPNDNNPEYIIIHHALAKSCTVKDIDRWHRQNGWAGIGYHYFISKDGFIYEGRQEKQHGAHCKQQRMNYRSIGICLEGCYQDYNNQTDKEVPQKQLKALINLTKHLQNKYNIPTNNVKRHHDFAPYKLCPGNYFPWDKYIDLVNGVLIDIKNHWAENNIERVVESGIMKGYSDGTFQPDKPITRAEFATAITRLIDKGLV
jgi:N-acetyl-anhydromuramyl-L-alanine amidase AmpD